MEYKKSSKEKEVFSYDNAKGETLWMFRHKYYDATGKRKEKKKSGFKTEKAAIKALYEVKAQTLHGNTKYIENENITVSEWLDIWFETNTKKWKVGTTVNREIIIRLQIKPLLGSFKVQKLDRATYQRVFINALIKKKYKPGTIRQLHSIFLIAINAAVEEEILQRNKFKNVSLPSSRSQEVESTVLTSEQIGTMLQYTKEHEDETYYSILLLISYTGMRKGEVLGLRWSNIDFVKQTIQIIHNRTRHGTGTTKTKNSERKIRVSSNVIEQLQRYQKLIKEKLLSKGAKINEDDFVFLSLESMVPMPLTTLHKGFKRIIKRAGLKECTIHSLRHSHATILMNDGIPVKAIAERLGNTPEMIYTTYGHILREMEDAIIDSFDRAIENGAKNGANL